MLYVTAKMEVFLNGSFRVGGGFRVTFDFLPTLNFKLETSNRFNHVRPLRFG